MLKKCNALRIFVITILIGMVFAVNLGSTFARFAYEKKVVGVAVDNPDETVDKNLNTYLNDVVINNSTTLIPISYNLGKVNREINFDYSFSQNTDIAITYELEYTDSSAVNNVKLDVVNRDKYIWDMPTVNAQMGATLLDSSSSTGTLFYLDYVPAGTGTFKILSGVEFFGANNVVKSYKATTNITINNSVYTALTSYNEMEYAYTQETIARYWKVSGYSDGNNAISSSEYNSLPADEQNAYSPSEYECIMSYTVDGTNVSAGTTATLAQYQSTYLLAGASNWQIQYYCVSNVSSYVEGTYISATDFSALTSEEQKSFEKRYVCQKDYSVTGSNSKTVAINEIITAEEYNQLISLEQNYFLPSEYLDYSNKKLKIDINVYTKANISSTNKTSGYYTEDHYFKNYVQSQNSSAYSYWLEYKQASSANGVVSVPQNRVLVYNGHGTFETGIPYSYDFAASEDITNLTARAGNVSAYVYDENDKFYAYAGGNKFNDGIGVYYLAKNSGSIKVSVSANWYNSRGEALSGVSINTINIAVSNDWVEISDSYYGYSKVIPANSYGYIDIVDYIQTITWGNIYNLVGCRLVVNSLSAEYLEDYSEWTASGTATKTSVSIENSTSTNPILFGYASHMGTSSTLDFNVAINNDSDQAVTVSSVVVTPKFVAYNGQTGANYGIARTKYISFGDYSSAGSKFIYDHNVWQLKSTNTDNVTGAISYTFATNGISIAPHSSISLISGVDIANSDAVAANWLIELGEGNSAKSFHADYWFEVETSSVSSAITDATYSSTTTAEFITELDNGTINSGASSYVAVRNNTLQTISNITFTANLANVSNLTNDIAYKLTNYATSSTTQNNSQANNISITFTGINLLPGESVILCLIEVTSGSNVGFTSYSINATLSSKPTLTNVYLKRDMASGNVSVINGTSETQSLSVVLADFANYGGNSPTVINDVTLLNGGEDKWTYNSADNSLTFDGDFLAGQMINLLENFYDYNVIKG